MGVGFQGRVCMRVGVGVEKGGSRVTNPPGLPRKEGVSGCSAKIRPVLGRWG